MKEFGMSCDTAQSGEEALARVERNGNYDIYFTDYNLPGMDGIELATLLRTKDPAFNQTSSVVMFSAASQDTRGDAAKNAVIDKFLQKPLCPCTVLDAIFDCLGVEHEQELDAAQEPADLFMGRRILLVEDVEINREIVLTLLEPLHLEIDCAVNGKEAVRMFSEAPDKYDMIFMDVQMPEMDGYEATRNIRAITIPQAKQIPIVAMTANVFREDIERCLAAGMNSHVGKPLNLNEVLESLRTYLSVAPKPVCYQSWQKN
jgi:CheY-like chemotaxis protein